MSRRIDGNAGKKVDEQRGSRMRRARERSAERGGAQNGKKFPFQQGHLTFKWAARSNGDARTANPGFSRVHNFRLKCEFP